MGDALFELEENLRSRSRKERLTHEEEEVLLRFKKQALSHFMTGAFGGGLMALAASWKLPPLLRAQFSFVTASVVGLWRFARSLDSSFDHVLGLDGTRMQRELANIVVNKCGNDPRKMQAISKYFYLEEIFDDSTPMPRLRWRYRNFFSDNAYQDQGTHADSQDVPHSASPSDSCDNSDSKKTALRSEKIAVNSGTDLISDPLDCVFGHTATAGEICHSTPSSMQSRAQSRARKRAHRKHRLRHQEGSSGSHDSKPSKLDVI